MITSTMLTLVFFAVYVAICIGIGYFASRNENEDAYMIANRDVSGVQLMATMSAGWFDGVTLAIYMAYVYQFGFAAISLFLGMSAGFLVFRQFAPRIKRKADEVNAYSMPEFFYHILGRNNAILISLLLLAQFFGFLVVGFIVSGKVLTQLLPFVPYAVSVVVGASIILTYLTLAGFKAVIRTDFFQLVVMICMTLLACLFFAPKVNMDAAEFSIARIGLGNLIGFFVIGSFTVMVGPDIWQRAFAARDVASLRRGLSYSAFLLPLLATIITVVGLATKSQLPDILPENVLVIAFSNLLPFGLKEFMLVLLYAVALSSSDTATFVLSSIVTRDLKNYTKSFDDDSMIKITRYVIIVSVCGAALIATMYQEIVQIALSLASLSLGLLPVVGASFFFKLNRKAVFFTLLLIPISVIAIAATQELNPESSLITLPAALLALPTFEICARAWGRIRRAK